MRPFEGCTTHTPYSTTRINIYPKFTLTKTALSESPLLFTVHWLPTSLPSEICLSGLILLGLLVITHLYLILIHLPYNIYGPLFDLLLTPWAPAETSHLLVVPCFVCFSILWPLGRSTSLENTLTGSINNFHNKKAQIQVPSR